MSSVLMNLTEAVRLLRYGSELPQLAEAIGVVVSSPNSSLFDIAMGLKYRGMIAEQAALALHKRMSVPLPENREEVVVNRDEWIDRIINFRTSPNRPSATSFGTAFVDAAALDSLKEMVTKELSRTERLILVLYYYENMTFPEIAIVLDLSALEVSTTHRDILVRMRERLTPDAEPLSNLLRDIAAGVAA